MSMELLLICGTLLFAFTISVIAVPSVVKVAISKKLFKPSGGRWIHKGIVPPFGGVAIFLGFIISSVIFTGNIQFHIYKYIISSVILIFFVGLKDDILNISARNKFLGQISATTILIIFGNLRITNLHGFGGIYNISFTFSFIISLFIILSLINAFNLIDGIDGLASGLGMVASSVLGSWFIAGGHIHYAILSFALAGSLAGFFLYNVFGKKYKLFMGDSGSMMIGLVISVLIIEFNELNLLDTTTSNYIIKSTPSVSFACVICPLIDMLRVMFIRLLYKKSPFSPDNNHIHHKLLKINSNHLYITSIIVTANIILIIIALAMNNAGWDITLQFLLIFALGIIYSFIPSIIKQTEQTKNKHSVLINYRD
jgi:UDP-GlcNAc:undecaprenyl-phosphate/decaprenyl-phosphate GlcNAc-1-phosphate transferase